MKPDLVPKSPVSFYHIAMLGDYVYEIGILSTSVTAIQSKLALLSRDPIRACCKIDCVYAVQYVFLTLTAVSYSVARIDARKLNGVPLESSPTSHHNFPKGGYFFIHGDVVCLYDANGGVQSTIARARATVWPWPLYQSEPVAAQTSSQIWPPTPIGIKEFGQEMVNIWIRGYPNGNIVLTYIIMTTSTLLELNLAGKQARQYQSSKFDYDEICHNDLADECGNCIKSCYWNRPRIQFPRPIISRDGFMRNALRTRHQRDRVCVYAKEGRLDGAGNPPIWAA